MFTNNSPFLTKLLEPFIEDCKSCKNMIYLPEFSIITAAKLVQLYTIGETQIMKKEERMEIICLMASLGCSGIVRTRNRGG